MRRTVVTLATAAAAALALGLAACAPAGSTGSGSGSTGGSGNAGDVKPLVVWGWIQDDGWKAVTEAYNKTNPDVKVEYRGFKADEYNKVLQTGLSGSSGPDVMMLRSYGGLETLVASGVLAPVDDVAGLKDFAEPIKLGATSRTDKKMYGVPFAIQTTNIQYNKAIFAKYGIAEPTTWAELTAAADKLQAAGITPFASTVKDSWMLPIVRDIFGAANYGGPAFATELLSGQAKFTDSRYTKANQTLLGLKKYMPKGVDGLSYTDAQTLFVSGKAAMWPGGIWDLATFRKQAPKMDIGLFNAPRSEGSGTAYAMGYVDGSWGLSAKTTGAKKDAALKYLGWLASKNYGQLLSDQQLQLSAVPGVEPKDPLLLKASKLYAENPTPYLTYVNFDYGTPAGSTLEYDALQKMMLGRETPDQVGTDLDKGVSQWFKPQR
ncbi:extracellular solute-binding protein [Kribbella sp. GL6]|uniref:extracellular solute-binding protein n=1 Tax=Kribbella sp. GL6 TaxID=3419765 RepID=UPI003CFF4920